ncbi:MAG TPA: hypothetical protein VG267_20880 [Terracidiphilus sp.]|nr:hypothetical protein [Terracidiphilus sp.]
MTMGSAAQAQAVKNYRKRLKKRGVARFEVVGLQSDRELIRKLARKLAEDPKGDEIRAAVEQKISEAPPEKGEIWAALRRSPLVGAGVKLKREFTTGRKIDL